MVGSARLCNGRIALSALEEIHLFDVVVLYSESAVEGHRTGDWDREVLVSKNFSRLVITMTRSRCCTVNGNVNLN